jgi:hypothetical protein
MGRDGCQTMILSAGQTVLIASEALQNVVASKVVVTTERLLIHTTIRAVVTHADTHLLTCAASIVAGVFRNTSAQYLLPIQSRDDANSVFGE